MRLTLASELRPVTRGTKFAQSRGAGISMCNSPECLAQAFVDCSAEHRVQIRYVQPGMPNQNAYVERFHRTYRKDVLDPCLFEHLSQVRRVTVRWLREYNAERLHDSLEAQTPTEYREALEARFRTLELST